MSNESDLVLEFRTDQERYYLMEDVNGNPIDAEINLEAKLFQGGEESGLEGDQSFLEAGFP